MPDFTTYQPPGVYVQDTSTPVVTPTGSAASLVTIVGPASGYETATETIALKVAGVGLSNRGVFTTSVSGPPAIAAPVVKTASGFTLLAGVDYSWTLDTSGGGGSPNAVALLVRIPASGSGPTPNGAVEGDLVTVSYSFTDPDYYTPALYSSYDQVVATYGPALAVAAPADANLTQVTSPLSMAAKVAFENGAGQVLALPTNPADANDLRTQLQVAYAKLLADPRVSILVPLLVDGATYGGSTSDGHTAATVANMIADARLHCEQSAAAGYGRIAIVGTDRTYDAATTPFPALAKNIADKRVVIPFPNRLLALNPSTNATIEVGGMYLAAAYAGQLAYNPVARGLTRLPIRSFTGLPPVVAQGMTKAAKDTMSQSGVAVSEINLAGTLVVRHGTTTDPSSLTTREISLVRIGDTLLQLVQTGLDFVGLIGQPIDAEMPTRVKGAITSILEQARLSAVIAAWGDLQVRQQQTPTGDPTVIEVRFAYQPLVPLNYIQVSFAIDLTSGDLTNTGTSPASSATGTTQ